MRLWPALCRPFERDVPVVGAEMYVPRRHLDRRVPEEAAEVVEVAARLDEPRREGVPQVVPPQAGDPGPAAGRGEALLEVAEPTAVRLGEERGGVPRPVFGGEDASDGGDRGV